eukprot:c15431_g1_i1.p1 GENE.c15431_g1_i1~~c15431_g1_i1.p1  ORF type:complete len:185 (+),score=18.59 c15431_g1_i1:58-555(+)
MAGKPVWCDYLVTKKKRNNAQRPQDCEKGSFDVPTLDVGVPFNISGVLLLRKNSQIRVPWTLNTKFCCDVFFGVANLANLASSAVEQCLANILNFSDVFVFNTNIIHSSVQEVTENERVLSIIFFDNNLEIWIFGLLKKCFAVPCFYELSHSTAAATVFTIFDCQ